MKNAKALKIAIEAIRQQIKVIQVDANFHDDLGADYPHAIKCSKRRLEYLKAIECLESMAKEPEQLGLF